MEKLDISKGMFGLNRKQVETYILDLEADFKLQLLEKDKLIEQIKADNEKLLNRVTNFEDMEHQLKIEKENITSVLLKAETQAKKIETDAKEKYEKEKLEINSILEKEREKILNIKQEVGELKKSVTDNLKKYIIDIEKI